MMLALGACIAALSAGTGCVGIEAGIDYPAESIDLGEFLQTPEGESGASVGLGTMKIKNDACQGIDTHPITQQLTQEDFTRFLESQGIKIAPKKARGNLYWYEFPNGDDPPNDMVRLRLAVLPTADLAAEDLHASLLDHGPGWWGLRRGNLAVLAPKASLGDALEFALSRKLVCWGMFTMADTDDAYVVPGPYAEL